MSSLSEIALAASIVSKKESWKYTKLYELKDTVFTNKLDNPKISTKWSSNFDVDSYKIEFLNGELVSVDEKMPKDVKVLSIAEAGKSYINPSNLEEYPFARLNVANAKEGVCIKIAKDSTIDKPIAIINKTSVGEENLFYNLQNIIVLGENANAEIFEHYAYSGDVKSKYFINILNTIFIEKNANLKHYKYQDESFKSFHIALNLVDVLSSGSYDSFCIQKGADVARNETRVSLKEENASSSINAAYIMNGWATIDTTTQIDHISPHTFSNQLVKGVVGGDAKGVFQGKIHIAKGALKAQGNQVHRALLLSDKAEVDCKPELEIFADDVKCSHGATSGVLDEMQLFYMRSRGIDIDNAKQILINAYLDDVISKISNIYISDWVKKGI